MRRWCGVMVAANRVSRCDASVVCCYIGTLPGERPIWCFHFTKMLASATQIWFEVCIGYKHHESAAGVVLWVVAVSGVYVFRLIYVILNNIASSHFSTHKDSQFRQIARQRHPNMICGLQLMQASLINSWVVFWVIYIYIIIIKQCNKKHAKKKKH